MTANYQRCARCGVHRPVATLENGVCLAIDFCERAAKRLAESGLKANGVHKP